MPNLPVHHQLPELAHTHVHRVSDAIQPSHPLSSPSPPAFSRSQHQGLFQWVSSSHQVAKGLEFQLQHQSFQWIFSKDFLLDGLVGSPCCPDSQQSSPTPQFKSINSLALSFLHSPTLSHPYMNTGKPIALTRQTFVGKVMPLLFNMLSRLVITFLARSKRLLISWLQSPSAVILEPQKIVCHCFHCFPIYLPWSDGTRCHDLRFLNVEFKPIFSLSSFTFIKRLFSSSLLSSIRMVLSAYLTLLIFFPSILIPACASSRSLST